jgi:tetratricopeptide (TPR) repeat protein
MQERNFSSAVLAGKIAVASSGRVRPDASLVWRWSKGVSRPGKRYLEMLAVVLDLDEQILRDDLEQHFRAKRSRTVLAEKPTESESGVDTLIDLGVLREVREHVKRRNLFRAVGALAVSSVAGPTDKNIDEELLELAAAAGKSGVSPTTLDLLSYYAEHYACNYREYPSASIVKALKPYLSVISRLLGGPLTFKQRGELCLRGAQISGLLGRAVFNLGRIGEARLHFSNAFQLASEIDHRNLMAWVIAEESVVALYVGDIDSALELARFTYQRVTGANLVHLLSNEARCAARIGDRSAAVRAIRMTEEKLGGVRPSEDSDVPLTPLFAFGRSAALHRISSSWVWLREPTLAQEAASAAIEITGHDGNSINRVHAQLALASSHVQQGNVDEACAIALSAFGSNPKNAYEVVSRSVELKIALSAYRDHPSVQEISHRLASYRRANLAIQ